MARNLRVVLVSFCLLIVVSVALIAAGKAVPSSKLKHRDVLTTVFWVGETSNADNGYIPNIASAWDGAWQKHYGGADAPAPRAAGYRPAAFTPKENPFYVALPYNDLDENGVRKKTADDCLKASGSKPIDYSWCKNLWVAVQHDDTIAYAQWEDVGPFEEDDDEYVFGTAPPKNSQGNRAGLDVSPAVHDYLKLQDADHTNWWFVRSEDVPAGPWKATITSSRGYRVE